MSRYQILDEVNRGGMGVIYRALDRLSGAIVALKKVTVPADELEFSSKVSNSSDEDFRLALAREFQILASLRHPHIIAVQDYGFEKDGNTKETPYFTMDYLQDSQTLFEAARGQTLAVKINFVIQMLQALAYLHRHGVIHRDLKPENVLVSHGQVKVLDFGLARVPRDENFDKRIMGTLAYMSPEVFRGEVAGVPSDLYAVGLMLYELLTDDFPYHRNNTAKLINEILMSRPNLTTLELLEASQAMPQFSHIIESLLHKTPAYRPQTADALIRELCAAMGIAEPVESSAIRESYLQNAQFVGRDTELKLFLDELEALQRGIGSAWLIGGESGVGKSRLLDELRTHALVQGVLVVRGNAVNTGGLSYQILRQPVRRLLINVVDNGLLSDLEASILKEIVPDISALIGRDVADAPELDARLGQQRLFTTVAALFQKQSQPILLIVEDLQWAREGLMLLNNLTQFLPQLPLFIVGSLRDDEAPELKSALPKMKMLTLQRLDAHNIAMLSESMLGDAGRHPDVLSLLQRETEGNVFFLVETVRALAEEAGRLSEVWRLNLPDSVFAGGVRAIVQRRLERAPEDAHELLRIAAVIGRQIDLRLLHVFSADQNSRQAAAQIEAWLVNCSNAAVLDWQDGDWRFSHDKLREMILDGLNADEKRNYNRSVAEAIEMVYPNDPQRAGALVNHWNKAEDAEKEITYLLIAARQSIDAQQMYEGEARARRGLSLLNDDDARRILFNNMLGEALVRLGKLAESIECFKLALEFAEKTGDTRRAALASVGAASTMWELGDYTTGYQHAQHGLALAVLIGDEFIEARAYNTIANILWYQGDQAQAEPYYEKCYEVALRSGNNRLIGIALNNLGLVYQEQGHYETALKYIQESLAIKETLGDERGISVAMSNLSLLAARLGDTEAEMDYLRRAIDISHKMGDRRAEAANIVNLASIFNKLKDVDTAAYWADRGLVIAHEIGDKPTVINGLLVLADTKLFAQDAATAGEPLQEAISLSLSIGASPKLLDVLIQCAWLVGLRGYFERAFEIIGAVNVHPSMMDDVRSTEMKKVIDALFARYEGDESLLNQAHSRGATLNFEQLVDDVQREIYQR